MPSVLDEIPYSEQVANGVSTVFGYTFTLLEATDLKVYDNGVLVASSQYSVSGVGDEGGGAVTFLVAPLNGHLILLSRELVLERDTDYQYNGPLREEVIDNDFNRLWQALQGQRAQIGGALRAPYPEQFAELPSAANRANKVLAFDGAGAPLLSIPTSGSAAALAILLADPTLVGNGAGMVARAQQSIDSIAALRLLLKTSPSKYARVNGYYVAGDGGGGEYYYDSADVVSADNGGTIIVAADGGRWKLSQQTPVSVRQFGAKGDGVTDDTAAIQAAVSWCRLNKPCAIVPRPSSYYLTTSSIVLSSDTLAPVSLIGEEPQWYGNETVTVRGDFNGPIFLCSGTVGTYAVAPYIGNLTIINRNAGVLACAVRADYTGGLRMDWCRVNTRNFGIYSVAEMISPIFFEVCIDTDAGASNGTGKAGYKLAARNTKIFGGRVYAQEVAYDYSGDILFVSGANAEFCQTIFRHTALAGAMFVGCHLETSQVLVTNASTIPTNYAGNWVDNGSVGTGISGAVQFIGGTCFFTGGVYGARSNLAVIKTGGGFGYRLIIKGMAISHPNPIVGNSFTPGTQVALPSGTKVDTTETDGITVVVPPSDAFSNYAVEAVNSARRYDKQRINDPQLGIQVINATLANGANLDIVTGLGQFINAVFELSWRASSAGYEYCAVHRTVQSFNVMNLGARQSSIGGGSADANWVLTWVPASGILRINNASGVTQNIVANFIILHRFS